MRLLEFESKKILKKYQIPIPPGILISEDAPIEIKHPMMLKAQIPIGGRSKSKGILEAFTTDEAKAGIEQLLSTRVKGYKPKTVLVEEKLEVDREFFMAITYDTVAKTPIAIFSIEGGVDIEAVSFSKSEILRKERFSIRSGLPQYRAREIISETGITGKPLQELSMILSKLADIFLDYDATLVEINPIARTTDGRYVALDCHLEIDDDALYRHRDIEALSKCAGRLESSHSMTDFERQALEIDQIDHRGVAGRVIAFDGSLGLIIGGGGASLTAFDAIQSHGGNPANYCEIGGNPSVRKVKELVQLILSQPKVQKIAVIMNVVSNTRVDLVARGIIKGILAAEKIPSETIAVFRIPGAWEEDGFQILSKYGVAHQDRTVSIDQAAQIAVNNLHR
jgi:succinyl-CoA synthetase beta subunit/citryl-CoA synthetase large subunit